MSEDKLTDETVMNVLTAHSAQIMRAECYLKAACEMLCAVSGNAGLDPRVVRATFERRADAILQSRLASVEDQNPALAAALDLRAIWSEEDWPAVQM